MNAITYNDNYDAASLWLLHMRHECSSARLPRPGRDPPKGREPGHRWCWCWPPSTPSYSFAVMLSVDSCIKNRLDNWMWTIAGHQRCESYCVHFKILRCKRYQKIIHRLVLRLVDLVPLHLDEVKLGEEIIWRHLKPGRRVCGIQAHFSEWRKERRRPMRDRQWLLEQGH